MHARFQDPIFSLLFPALALFLAPNHNSSPITIIILAIHPSPIITLLLLRMPGSSKMAENRPHFLRSVAIAAVHPVYIYIVERGCLGCLKQKCIETVRTLVLQIEYFLGVLLKMKLFYSILCQILHYSSNFTFISVITIYHLFLYCITIHCQKILQKMIILKVGNKKNKVGSKKEFFLITSQRYIYKLDGLHNVKKILPMPDSKIQLLGSFFLLWCCFWFLITIFTDN